MSRAQRIAFVAPRFPEGPTVGGAETLLKALATRAAAAGRQVSFLTTCARNHFTWDNEVPAGSRRVDGMDVTFFPVDGDRDLPTFLQVQERISRGVTVSLDEEQAWLRNNVNSPALYEHLRQRGADYDRLVMGPYLFGLTYAAAQIHPEKTFLVPCLHDEVFAYLASFKSMFESVRGCLFNTAPERELAARLYGDRFLRQPVVGMGLEPFEADKTAFALRTGLTAPYLIYSGRREPLKGTPLLLDYLAAFRSRTGRDVKLVLTGSGAFDPPDSLTPHVRDLGFVSEQEKHEAMAGALAFCHPSVNESLGIVLLEAWMGRTPGLVRAACKVLAHQCRTAQGGLWFRTYPEFEEALLLLVDHPDVGRAMGEAGREFVLREYAWSAVEPRLLQALDA